MNVTRDVIIDLWPIYEAGEASRDTAALVESYLAGDQELAKRLGRAKEAARRVLEQNGGAAPAEGERRMVAATRRRLGRQRWLTGAAVFLSVLPFSFGDLGDGPRLLITDLRVRAVMLIPAAVLWFALWRATRRGTG